MALRGYIPKYKKRTYLGPAADKKKRIQEKHSASLKAASTLEQMAKPQKKVRISETATIGFLDHSYEKIRTREVAISELKQFPLTAKLLRVGRLKYNCSIHDYFIKGAKPIRKSPRKISKIHLTELALYTFLKRFHIARNKINPSLDLHHVRGKLKTLRIDIRFWKFLTRDEHNFVQNNPNKARNYGWLCEPGEWNNAPDDEVTRQLTDIMHLARTSIKEAKQRLVKLFYP